MTNSNVISCTVQAVLTAALLHPDDLVILPPHLPVAAQRAVARSMLKAGLVEETPAGDDEPAWRTAETGVRWLLRATPTGLAAVGASSLDESAATNVSREQGGQETACSAEPPAAEPTAPAALNPRVRLRAAAEAVLAAWDDKVDGHLTLPSALETLRSALATTGPTRPHTGRTRAPRAGTKQQAVLTLLRRPEGASIAQVAGATGWASHTVRGFFAGLKKKAITVDVLERVRQVGSGKQGAKGSYTVYRVAEAG